MHESTTETNTASRAADAVPPLAVTFATGQRISGLGLTTLWRLARERQIETVRVGRRTLITYRSLARLLLPDNASTQPVVVADHRKCSGPPHRRKRTDRRG
jgi:hypothetical protein